MPKLTHDFSSYSEYLGIALEKANAELDRTPSTEPRLRQRIEAEVALISATFGLITGDDADESRREWLEASQDFD